MTFIPAVVGIVSSTNSSTTPLGIGASFTGAWVEVVQYNGVVVSGSSDAPDATLFIQFSTDASTVDVNITNPITADSFSATSIVRAQYVRVVYTNGATAQSTFNLQTTLKTDSNAGASNNLFGGSSSIFDPLLDSFGRLRTASPTTVFDSKFHTSRNLDEWDEITSGTGSITYTTEFPYVNLIVGAGNGRAVRQTRRYNTYQPGKAFEVLVTGTLEITGGIANVVSRIGIFDDATDKTDGTVSDAAQSNGYFFELDGTTLNVVEYSYITGVLVTTRVAQSAFNLDTLDGTGQSGVVIDPSRRQIFFISQEWLGVGNVVMGIYIGATPIPCHVFRHSNQTSTLPFTNRASLPLRYEIVASGSGSGATQRQICCTVISNGGIVPNGKVFSASNELTFINNIAATLPPDPIIALRIDKTRCARAILTPIDISLLCLTAGNMYYAVYRVLAPANPFAAVTWNNVNTTYSCAQIARNNAAGTALTWAGGFPGSTSVIRLTEGYFSNNNDAKVKEFKDRLIAVADIVGDSDTIVVGMASLSGFAEDVCAAITWQEYE